MRPSLQTTGLKLLTVGGLALLLAGLMLLGATTLSKAENQRVGRYNHTALYDQVGIAACPSTPKISFSPTNPNPGQEVTFQGTITATGGGGAITFTWNFGDGSAPLNATDFAKHTYSLNGVYTVVLTATSDSCGSPPSSSKVITVGFGTPVVQLYLPIIYGPVFLPTALQAPPKLPAPAQVTGVSGKTYPYGTLIRWQAADAADLAAYHLYRLSPETGETQRLATVGPTSTAFVDVGNNCGYAYYITAVNNAGGESMASTAAYFSPACPNSARHEGNQEWTE